MQRVVPRLGRSIRLYSTKYPNPPSYYTATGPKWYFGRLMLATFVAGCAVTYNYTLSDLYEMYIDHPRTAEEQQRYLDKLETRLGQLDVVQKLSQDPDYSSARKWGSLDDLPSGLSAFHNVVGVCGGIGIKPLYFHKNKANSETEGTEEDIIVLHIGKLLQGYPLLTHGGMLGMILDEVNKQCVANETDLPLNKLHTSRLELTYKFPSLVNQFVVIRSGIQKGEKKNEWVVNSGIYTTGGRLLVKSVSEFIKN